MTRSNLKASTAILQPNLPGSSSLKLSWIWQTGRWYLFNSDANHVADAEGHEKEESDDEDSGDKENSDDEDNSYE